MAVAILPVPSIDPDPCALPRPRIVSVTMCYPSREHPQSGVFVQRRLERLARLADVRVLCVRPWFPLLRPFGDGSHNDSTDGPATRTTRMLYLPGVLKSADAAWFARAAEPALRSMMRERPIDVVDAHFEWPDGVGAWRAARRLGLRVAVTLRGKLVSQSRSAVRRRQMADMLRDADALIAVSRSLARLAEQIAGRRLNVRVIPNGVDPDIFHPLDREAARRRLGWPDARYWLVSVGHWQRLKGFDVLVEAMPRLRARLGDVRLALVGGDAGEAGFRRRVMGRIERLGLREAVVSLGRVAPATVNDALNAADAFVLASRSEGCCNALLEALATGTPVVASDIDGNREIVVSKSLGRLFRADDPDALTDEVEASLSAAYDRERIAAAGRARSWEQVAAEALTVLGGVAGRAAARR